MTAQPGECRLVLATWIVDGIGRHPWLKTRCSQSIQVRVQTWLLKEIEMKDKIGHFIVFLFLAAFIGLSFHYTFVFADVIDTAFAAEIVPEATPTEEPLVECELFSENDGFKTYRCHDPDFGKVCYDKPSTIMWCEPEE